MEDIEKVMRFIDVQLIFYLFMIITAFSLLLRRYRSFRLICSSSLSTLFPRLLCSRTIFLQMFCLLPLNDRILVFSASQNRLTLITNSVLSDEGNSCGSISTIDVKSSAPISKWKSEETDKDAVGKKLSSGLT